MKLRQLEYFILVANTLNITHAAERARVSQPALSRQIQLLEEELGSKLVERKARGVTLTPVGERLAEHLRALLHNIDHIKGDIISSANEPVGLVRLAIAYSVGSIVTTAVVSAFRERYPAVQIQIFEGTSLNIREALIANKADVALYSDHGSFTGMNRIPLCEEALVLIAPKEAGLSMNTPLDSRELGRLPIILTPFPNGLRQTIDEAVMRSGQTLDPIITVDTNSLMLNLVRVGCGYAVLPYSGTHEAYRQGFVSIAPIRDMPWKWVVATSRERPLSAAGRVLVDMIVDHTQGLLRDGGWPTAKSVI